MSKATIDIMNQHREDQIKFNPSSELFQIIGGGSFYGIFDKSHQELQKDSGNNQIKTLRGSILVSEVPFGLIGRETKIVREDSTEYTFFYEGLDDNGVPILWLF